MTPDIRSAAVDREELLATAGEMRETYAALHWSTSLLGSLEG
jgi:propanediol dehydratase small subunit